MIGGRFWKCVWKEARPESEHQGVLEILLVKGNEEGHGDKKTSHRGDFVKEPTGLL